MSPPNIFRLFRLPRPIVRCLSGLYERSRTTPYYHLDGYMLRWWILGDRSATRNANRPSFAPVWHGRTASALYRWITDRVAVRAHLLLRSDSERCLHDHPCASVSIVLEGGYWEVCEVDPSILPGRRDVYLDLLQRLDGEASLQPDPALVEAAREFNVFWRGPGDVVVRSSGSFHRLVLPTGSKTRSIFILGKRSREWGFLTERGKVGAREYLDDANPMSPRDSGVHPLAEQDLEMVLAGRPQPLLDKAA